MIDLLTHLAAVHRSVARRPGNPDEVVEVTLRRTYPTDRRDLWSALTEPARIARWFAPISCELTVGGRFQPTAAGASPEEIEPVRQMAMAQFAPHIDAGG